MDKPQFVISAKTGDWYHPRRQRFVHHAEGHRYGTRAMAQKSLNAALARDSSIRDMEPVIIPICEKKVPSADSHSTRGLEERPLHQF